MKPSPAVLALLFVGTLLLAIGTFTRSWVTAGEDKFSFNIGLRDAKSCGGDECETFSYTKLIKDARRGRDVAMAVTGMATFGWGIIAMIFAAITGFLYLSQKPKNVLAVLTIIFASIAFICAIAFLASMDKPGKASYGFSLFLFIAGYASVLVGSIMSMSKRSLAARPGGYGQPPGGYPPGYPHQQQGYAPQGYHNQSGGMAPAANQSGGMHHPQGQQPQGGQGMAPQAGPNCQSCGRPATFVQQYQRYFCTTCNRYL